jgi:hypothetical protein
MLTRSLEDGVDRAADSLGGFAWIWCSDVEPRENRLDGDHRDEPRGPVKPGPLGKPPGQVAAGGIGRDGRVGVDDVTELRLSGGVAEQEPEPVGVSAGGADEGRDRSFSEVIATDGVSQPGAGSVEHGSVQVGFGLEVPVQEHLAHTRFGGDVVEAGRGETAAGEGAGRGVEHLLAARPSPQSRRRPVDGADVTLILYAKECTTRSVHSYMYI